MISKWLFLKYFHCYYLYRGAASTSTTWSSSPAPSPPSAGSSSRTTPPRWVPQSGIESLVLNYFQFIDKKFQSGQHYVHKITKLHRDSFSKVILTIARLERLNLLTILINCNKSIVWASGWTAAQTRTFRQSSHDTPLPGLTQPPVPLSYNENKSISLENP